MLLLVAGIFFRFYNLDNKAYWHDETRTSLRIAGYRVSELIEQKFQGDETTAQELLQFQQINPNRPVISTLVSLAANDPKHPPLYYGLVRLWAQIMGDSVGIVRSFSAWISLLAFPCLFWLCLELFGSPLTAWLAIALLAISPFHLLYAQEAREYSLWTVTILGSSAALLRAMRRRTRGSWGLYAAALTAGMYSFTLFLLVIVAHGLYVAGVNYRRPNRWWRPGWLSSPVVQGYGQAAGIALGAFVPWAGIIALRMQQLRGNTGHLVNPTDVGELLRYWLIGLSSLVYDPNPYAVVFQGYGSYPAWLDGLRWLALALLVYGVVSLCRHSSRQVWLLPTALIGTQVMTMMLPDLILGIRLSLAPRYLIPLYLGLHLALAYSLCRLVLTKGWLRWLGQGILVAAVAASLGSNLVSAQSQAWWHKGPSMFYPEAAALIREAKTPLVMSNARGMNSGNLISLSHLLPPQTRLLPITQAEVPPLPKDVSDIFVLGPTPELRQILENQYRLQLVHEPAQLWQIKQ